MVADGDLVCGLCGGRDLRIVQHFDAPPLGETVFEFDRYDRTLWQCNCCGHVVNRHNMDLAQLYAGKYVEATYGDRLAANFDRIMALPPERSDNYGRAERVDRWWREHAPNAGPGRLLDVGTGLAVFPAAMVARDWTVEAVDPDPQAVAHAESRMPVTMQCGDFMQLQPRPVFDMVTLNKVLEHVPQMVEMLARVRHWLLPGGAVYVELPDGEAALAEGPAREEFLVEHYCAFSFASMALLARRAGFQVEIIERLREPSGKFTLRGFFMPSVPAR